MVRFGHVYYRMGELPAMSLGYRQNKIIARHNKAMMITLASAPFLRSSFRVSQERIFIASPFPPDLSASLL
jgi:hypothetical protein